jgi:TfdA family taurine catabolism dioxygenase TauD
MPALPEDACLLSTLDGKPDGLPLVIEPRDRRDAGALEAWLALHGAWVAERLRRHGAILLRGFAVDAPEDFERVARAIDPALGSEYLGTSPRSALTPHVFTASELPGFYPIPQHCEMSFVKEPPRHLFFCCLVAPAEGSGETPLEDLDPELVRRLEQGGLRIVRNYAGPGGGGFDLWKLKRWDEMFGTTDRAAVERKCAEQGFATTWLPGGGLRLVSTQALTRAHPETGERAWHNHLTTFHLSSAPDEYRQIQRLRPSLRTWLLAGVSRTLVAAQRRTRSADEQSMHCTRADGSEIPDADVAAVREAIWRRMVVFSWRRGDVLAIDNYAVSHGRLPYAGPREIAVAWA